MKYVSQNHSTASVVSSWYQCLPDHCVLGPIVSLTQKHRNLNIKIVGFECRMHAVKNGKYHYSEGRDWGKFLKTSDTL